MIDRRTLIQEIVNKGFILLYCYGGICLYSEAYRLESRVTKLHLLERKPTAKSWGKSSDNCMLNMQSVIKLFAAEEDKLSLVVTSCWKGQVRYGITTQKVKPDEECTVSGNSKACQYSLMVTLN